MVDGPYTYQLSFSSDKETLLGSSSNFKIRVKSSCKTSAVTPQWTEKEVTAGDRLLETGPERIQTIIVAWAVNVPKTPYFRPGSKHKLNLHASKIKSIFIELKGLGSALETSFNSVSFASPGLTGGLLDEICIKTNDCNDTTLQPSFFGRNWNYRRNLIINWNMIRIDDRYLTRLDNTLTRLPRLMNSLNSFLNTNSLFHKCIKFWISWIDSARTHQHFPFL